MIKSADISFLSILVFGRVNLKETEAHCDEERKERSHEGLTSALGNLKPSAQRDCPAVRET